MRLKQESVTATTYDILVRFKSRRGSLRNRESEKDTTRGIEVGVAKVVAKNKYGIRRFYDRINSS